MSDQPQSQYEWAKPDPSGPAWCSKTDYYLGTAEFARRAGLIRQPSSVGYPTRSKRRRRYVRAVLCTVLMLLSLGGALYDSLTRTLKPGPSLGAAVIFGVAAVINYAMARATARRR